MENTTTWLETETRPALTLVPPAGIKEPPPLRGVQVVDRERTMCHVLVAVCAFSGISDDEIRSRDRHGHIAWARQVAYAMCREFARATYSEIGRFFGRDHASVMSGIKHVESVTQVYPRVRAELDDLRTAIRDALATP